MKNWHILVVEDEQDGGEVISELLAHFGVKTDVTANGEAGLELLRTRCYDAAIIDLSLPGMNGLELLARIRKLDQCHDLPCIAFTAYHTSKVRKEALDSGFDDYLNKPVPFKTLLSKLREVISARGAPAQPDQPT
ncbi:MAG: response regulator [Chloroflexota bacterium]